MKKIWIIEPYLSIESATERQTILAGYLDKAGYDTVIICSNSDSKYNPDGKPYRLVKLYGVKYMLINMNLRVYSGSKRVLTQIQFQQNVKKYAAKALGKPDLVIGNFAGIFGDVVFHYKKKYGTKVILDILDFWPEVLVDLGHLKEDSLITKYLYRREYLSYRFCDSLFFSMPGGKDYIIEKGWDKEHGGKININKIHYLNNGVDIISVDHDRETYILDDIDLNHNECFKIGYIGAIGVPNDISMLVKTARLAQDKHNNDIKFLIYGWGNQLDKVKELADEWGLKNIIFKGPLEKKFFPSTINRCDLAILNFVEAPTLRFGLSNNKFFMYCASGMPVLCTVHPRYSVIEERKCGIIVDHNPEAILKGIQQFQKMDPAEYETYKKNARKVGEDYDYGVLFKTLQKEVVRLIGE